MALVPAPAGRGGPHLRDAAGDDGTLGKFSGLLGPRHCRLPIGRTKPPGCGITTPGSGAQRAEAEIQRREADAQRREADRQSQATNPEEGAPKRTPRAMAAAAAERTEPRKWPKPASRRRRRAELHRDNGVATARLGKMGALVAMSLYAGRSMPHCRL